MNERLKVSLHFLLLTNAIRSEDEPTVSVVLAGGTELHPVKLVAERRSDVLNFKGNLTCKVYGSGGRRLGVCVIDTTEDLAGWQLDWQLGPEDRTRWR